MRFKSVYSLIVATILLLLCDLSISARTKDLYTLLGVKKSASAKEIRKAYRQKAKETHPDKRQGDPETAAEEFRNVVEAFETLSDDSARKQYDKTGQTLNQQNNRGNAQRDSGDGGGGGGGGGFNFNNFGFGFGFNGFNGFNSDSSSRFSRRTHPFLFDPYRRRHILMSQSRVINVKPRLRHIRSVMSVSDQEDVDECRGRSQDASSSSSSSSSSQCGNMHSDFSEDEDDGMDQQVLDRFVLIAFYDSSMELCTHILNNELLFPWPFAGYSVGEQGSGSDLGIWWEDILMTARVDMKSGANSDVDEVAKVFNLNMEPRSADSLKSAAKNEVLAKRAMKAGTCPSFAILPRGSNIKNIFSPNAIQTRSFRDSSDFRDWVWTELKVTITIINSTPWPLHLWWLDGFIGKRQKDVAVDDTVVMDTYLSHSFFARANFVTGNTLTNESGLFWQTIKPQDNQKTFIIKPRCFDHSGECPRWEREGFCNVNGRTNNPAHKKWVLENCFVSCKFGCGAVKK